MAVAESVILPLQNLFVNFQVMLPAHLWSLWEAEAHFQSLSAAQKMHGNCDLQDITLGSLCGCPARCCHGLQES